MAKRKIKPFSGTPCQMCGVNMVTVESTGHRGNAAAGSFHADCAYMTYLYTHADLNVHDHLKSDVARARQKLINKHQGVATDFP
jgi:hypothetical protein